MGPLLNYDRNTMNRGSGCSSNHVSVKPCHTDTPLHDTPLQAPAICVGHLHVVHQILKVDAQLNVVVMACV